MRRMPHLVFKQSKTRSTFSYLPIAAVLGVKWRTAAATYQITLTHAGQWLKWKISGKGAPFSASVPIFQHGFPAMMTRPIRCWCERIFDDIFYCNKRLSSITLHRCCHLVGYNRSCSVLTTVSVQFYKLGDAGTLFANNQRCRNARPCVPRHFNHSSWIFPILHNMGQEMPPKLRISLRRAGMPHNNLFLGPTDPYPNSISIHSAVLAQLMVVTNRQTDTQIMLLYYYFQLLFY